MPDLKPAMHGRDHCPGGADPIPCLVSDYAYLNNASGSLTVPSDTAYNVYDDEPASEGFIKEPDGAGFQLGLDLNEGTITWNRPGLYLIQGQVNWTDDMSAGTYVNLMIDFGQAGTFASYRVGNGVPVTSLDRAEKTTITDLRFSFNPGLFDFNSVRLLVAHDCGADRVVDGFFLWVARLSPSASGEFYYPS
jgi:hypothetical protein